MYCHQNYATKKALKEAVARGEVVRVYQAGPFGGNEPTEGRISVEGPHYPQPHKWYASCDLHDGRIVKVR